jgi:NADH-quinone oxidoreductase subunit N
MTQTDFIVLLPLFILAGWLLALLLVEAFLPVERKMLVGWLSLPGFAAAALALIAWPAGGRWEAFGGLIVADGFAAFLTLLFLFSGAVAALLALNYLPRVGLPRGEFYVLLMLSVSGMVLMSQATDLVIVFLALELLSIPLYILAGIARPRLDSEEAAMKYFLLGAFSSGFFVYGVALTYGATGSTNLAEILAAERSLLLMLGAALMLVGLAFKVAAVPFHMWTPDVYDGSPSVVTAFMAVGAKAGGFAALLRVFVTALPAITPQWAGALALLAALTMILGNFAAIAQSNIKRMLAYSSIAHAGYILMALPAAGDAQVSGAAVGAALFYLLAYALTTLGAWAVVMAVEQRAVEQRTVERREQEGLALNDYAGLFARQPALALGMAVFMVSLTGLPPTSGFIAKATVFQAAIDAGYLWLAVIGVVTSLVSAYYYLRVVVLMFMRPGAGEALRHPLVNLAVGATAAATFLLGLLPGPLLQLAQQSVAAFIR